MTEYVRVPREAVEEIADDLRAISLELTKKRATTPVSEDVFRKALELEAMLAASPQGEGSSADTQGWRDIATAPRDGTHFLAVDDCGDASRCAYHAHGYIMSFCGQPVVQPFEPIWWRPWVSVPPPSAHPAPIKPSGDTGELRDRVARIIDPSAFLFSRDELDAKVRHHPHDAAYALADAILDLIQSERAGPRVSILSTKFVGDNTNGQPIFEGGADGVTNITLHGWTCFGPDEAGQKALAGFQSERAK